MNYTDTERLKRRREFALAIEEENPPQLVCHALFVYEELAEHNQLYSLLDGDDQDKISEGIMNAAFTIPEMMGKIGRDNVINNKDFDLAILCLQLACDMTKDITDKKKQNNVIEIYETCLSALFRLWIENITNKDIIDYYKGESNRDLSILMNRTENYHWAQEKGIFCSDVGCLLGSTQHRPISADDEIEGLRELGKLCKLFDQHRPQIVKTMGIEDSFIEENLKTCRNVFMLSFTLYAIIPGIVDTKELINDSQRLKDVYETFFLEMTNDSIKKELLVEKNRANYEKIYIYTIRMSAKMEEDGIQYFAASRDDLYKELTARELGKEDEA